MDNVIEATSCFQKIALSTVEVMCSQTHLSEEYRSCLLQQIPDDDVLRELSEQVGNCAMQLGVELGLSMVKIEETLSNYSKDMFIIYYLLYEQNYSYID
jgi:hypothetical protein